MIWGAPGAEGIVQVVTKARAGEHRTCSGRSGGRNAATKA